MRSIAPASIFSMRLRPSVSAASSMSRTRTSNPAWAHAWAIPLPMFPPPRTAMVAGGRSGEVAIGETASRRNPPRPGTRGPG